MKKLNPIHIILLHNIGFSTSSKVHPESADAAVEIYNLVSTSTALQPFVDDLKDEKYIYEERGVLKFTKKGRTKYSKHSTTMERQLELNQFQTLSDELIVFLLPYFMREVTHRVSKSDRFATMLGNEIKDNLEGFNRITGEFQDAYSEAYGLVDEAMAA